jgi:hypothetical protein
MGQDELVHAAFVARVQATQAHEGLVEAYTTCGQQTAAMPALEARVAADREALAAAMEELGRVTGEAAARLAVAVNEAAVAVGEVADAAGGVSVLGPRMLGAVGVDLDNAAAQLGKVGTAIGQLVTEIQGLHRSTFERIGSAERQLQSESDRTESLLGDPKAAFERAKTTMEDLFGDALELIETTLPQAMERMVELWETRREQALERAEDAFAAMLQHADEVTAHCSFQLGTMLGAEREAATGEAQRIAGELQGLASSLDTRKTELDAALDLLADRLVREEDDLRVVTHQLDEVRGRWATFGFGS